MCKDGISLYGCMIIKYDPCFLKYAYNVSNTMFECSNSIPVYEPQLNVGPSGCCTKNVIYPCLTKLISE